MFGLLARWFGLSESSPPPPKKLTDYPWRQPSKWNKELEQSIMSDIKRLKPGAQIKPNLLFLGPVAGGKSSLINSMISIGIGLKCSDALTGTASNASYTVIFEKYTEASLLENVRLSDCMGLEPVDGHGFHPEDIIALIKGHIETSYKFNPASPLAEGDPRYRKDPEFKDQIHCVVFVISAVAMYNGIPRGYIQKIKYLQEKIKREGIPRVLVLTQVDRLCDEVAKDISLLFRSVKVEKAVKTANEVFGIEMASIYPVKNYEVDIELSYMTNIPLLIAMRQAMQYADRRIYKFLNRHE